MTMRRFLYLLFVLLNTNNVYSGDLATAGPTVKLSYGTFQGLSTQGIDKFLGIPYATAGRFELPRTPAHLPGIQQATAFGSACPQQARNLSVLSIPELPPIFPISAPLNMSENCLFVNVIKPAVIPPGAKLPVLFWIYGGGFEDGDTSQNDGTTVVARSIALGEPVIYVSVNYRLNAFGFAASEEIKAAGLGNLGLRDQRFGMQWVQNNIALFGGDRTKVTIWGESAGAISVALHLFVNGGNQGGLFRSAFMESGSPLGLSDITTGQPFFDQLVANTDCTGSRNVLACLKAVPFDTFQAAVNKSPSIFSFMSLQLAWQPRVDGIFITESPQASIPKGAFSNVPLVSGDCDDEATLFSLTTLNLTTDQEAVNYLHNNYFPAASNAQFQALANLYPSDPVVGSPFDTGAANAITPEFKRIAAFQGDLFFQAPRRFFLQTASKRQKIFSFLFKRGKTTPVLGAFHGSDIPEFYGAPTVGVPDFQGTDALVNFANTGNPNTGAKVNISTLIFWPSYSTSVAAPPMLTFLDPNVLTVTTDTFRVIPIQAITDLSRRFP